MNEKKKNIVRVVATAYYILHFKARIILSLTEKYFNSGGIGRILI